VVVVAARVGMAAVLAVTLVSCVNLSYPPGATRNGDGGFMAHVANGLPCRSGSECQSGSCADGLCCNEACTGTCLTCKRAGSEGRCTMAEEGTDVRDECKDDGAASCHLNGVCDGAGACQTYSLGTICQPGLCNLGQLTPVGRCDGTGTCVQPPAHPCRPYQCSAVDLVCLTSCTTNDECASLTRCVNGTCGALPIGSPCALATDCDSKFCEDGFCCATACDGGCKSCGLMGSAGTCTFVPAGVAPNPATTCATMDASTCQTDGTCDGAGACRLHPAGKVCGAATCSTATLHAASTCDGKGHCQLPAAVTCGGYTCATAATCRTSCLADLDCASPSVCGQGAACGGLVGQYFRQTNLTDQAFMRTDPAINFNWGPGAPMGLNVDNFSVRWHGKITARFSDTYTFFSGSDDGERLIVGGQLLIDRYTRHASVPEDVSKTIVLQAGQPTDITFEYFENGGDANVYLSWQSMPNAAGVSLEPKAVVPTSALAPQ
jgi:hypothetical protein